MDKKLHLVSLGCTKNLVDSEVMLGKLKDYKLTENPQEADVIIVNTCGFINAAKEESLNTILTLHKERKKDSLLVMSGCLSERYKEELQKELKEVDIFTGVGDYDKIDEIIEKKKSAFSPKTYLLRDEERVIIGSTFHAYIKLSEGCNQKCSFCAIPSFKGTLKSRELESVVNEVKNLAKKGFWDFSFISQDSSSYLRDLGYKDALIDLIDEIEKIEGVKSARILYLYPSTLSDALIDRIISSPIFHNYFDMPIQHISDRMLKIMKRGAGKEVILRQLKKMREAENSFLRTSVIVGHPGESENDFKELENFLKDFDFDRVNIFAYSDEEGTKAYEMKDKIKKEIIDERIEALDSIVEEKFIKSLKKDLNKEADIVIEGENSEHEYLLGARKIIWAPQIDGEILINDKEIEDDLEIGKTYKAKITQIAGDKLIGTVTKTL